MIIKHINEIEKEAITGKGVKGVEKQRILSADDGAPNFTLRRFSIDPGGYTFYHTHDFEHEVYVLSGSGTVRRKNNEVQICKDSAILVVPNEIHQFINSGENSLIFLCIIPNQ